MKVTFWLLDINSQKRDDGTELWLWGVNANGERVLIVDKHFVDYFYAVVKEGFNPQKVAEEIKQAHGGTVVKAEVAARRFFGKPVQTVKVYCTDAAKELRTFEGVRECLEDDIRPSMRYLVDNNVVPCGWHQVEATEEKNTLGVRVDKLYAAESPPKLLEKSEVPPLRLLSFFMPCYSREGSPKPNRNPIIMISTVTNNGEEKQFLADEDKNDKTLLQKFIDYVADFDPDIIAGYGSNTQDMAYMRERCRIHGLKLSLDRAGTEPHTSVYGHVSLIGVAHLDLADFNDQFPDVKVKTLENLADHLGVMKLENRTIIWDVDFPDYWDDKQKRSILMSYAIENARCAKGITEALLDLAMQLSNLVGLPLDHVLTASVGFRIEWFLIKRAHMIGELVPKRVEQPYRPYAGGIVLKPHAGLHENIAVLDFKSMYPNLMITYNLSPDTYVAPKEPVPKGGVFEAPEVKHKFKKEPPGFYKEVLLYLIGFRGEIRAKMKTLSPTNVDYQVLDARQKAVKVITNAAYGYAGWVGARWYNKPVAEAVSAWGRDTILSAVKMAENAGLKVIYGDTDSLFATFDAKKTAKLEKEIEKKLRLEVESDKKYVRIFFTEAKKRYAGLLPDGTVDIVGLEVIRGDWAEVAKNTQEHVLEIILKEQSPPKASDFVHKMIADVKERKVPFRDFIIWKTLTKPIEDYAIKASHVEAARMLREKGWKMTVGDKVGYVIVKGQGRLYERVKPYIYALYDEVDVDYYITKQIVPAAARILEFFGVKEEDLLNDKGKEEKSKSLMEFMGG